MAPEDAPEVSVILPTYNEIDTIVNVIQDVQLELTRPPAVAHEIIVVDDDSPDGTAAHVGRTFDDDRVRVIVRDDQTGLSSAVLDGLDLAKARFAIVMDADGQHPPERVSAVFTALVDGADLVVGSRHAADGTIEGWSLSRRLVSRVAAGIAQLSVPAARRLSDPMSGFFGVDLQAADAAVREQCDPHGYKILLELATHMPDAVVDDVPITFRDRQGGRSKLTLDEQLRFLEHVGTLSMRARGLHERVQIPLLIRSLEVGVLFGAGVLLLFTGLIIGDVDGAAGAALIAGAGGLYTLGGMRAARAGSTWETTDERLAKEGSR